MTYWPSLLAILQADIFLGRTLLLSVVLYRNSLHLLGNKGLRGMTVAALQIRTLGPPDWVDQHLSWARPWERVFSAWSTCGLVVWPTPALPLGAFISPSVPQLHTEYLLKDFPGGLEGKESPCNAGSIPGSGRSPGEGNGNPLQYSCLENPMEQRSLADYSLWGYKESDTTEQLIHTRLALLMENTGLLFIFLQQWCSPSLLNYVCGCWYWTLVELPFHLIFIFDHLLIFIPS